MSLYGGTGLGAAGNGVPSGGNVSLPAILAALQQQQGGAPSAAPTPLAPGGAPTPMANYIGAPGGGMAMQHAPMPMMPQAAAPQQPQGIGQALQGGSQSLMQQIALLDKLKQGQNGLTPQGPAPNNIGPASGSGGAGSMIPAWLQAMLHSGSYGATGAGMAPAVGPGGMMGGGV
jgi:hypothetical protein